MQEKLISKILTYIFLQMSGESFSTSGHTSLMEDLTAQTYESSTSMDVGNSVAETEDYGPPHANCWPPHCN